MTTFNVKRKTVSSLRTTNALLSTNNRLVIQLWLTSYPLRELGKATHQTNRASRTGVLQREYRGLRPRDFTQHHTPERVTTFQTKGHQLTTCPQIWRSLEGHMVWSEGIKSYSLSDSQVWIVHYNTKLKREFLTRILRLTKASEPLRPAPNRCQVQSFLPFCRFSSSRFDWLSSTDFPATSVGAACGKRASLPFTTPIQKDCMVRTRLMEIHAQVLPSSSRSPEVAVMEK